MKKLKIVNFNENRGLSDYARQMVSNEIHKSCPIMDFKCTTLPSGSNTYRIKHVKCYRMKSTSPVRLWILSALYYFNPQIHEKSENCQFQ